MTQTQVFDVLDYISTAMMLTPVHFSDCLMFIVHFNAFITLDRSAQLCCMLLNENIVENVTGMFHHIVIYCRNQRDEDFNYANIHDAYYANVRHS